jgi:hypothetical protein
LKTSIFLAGMAARIDKSGMVARINKSGMVARVDKSGRASPPRAHLDKGAAILNASHVGLAFR